MKPGLQKGQLVRWKDDRGFGFIQPADGSKQVFLHISDLKDTSRRPIVGDTIYYNVVPDKGGKVRASNALIQNANENAVSITPSERNKAVYKRSLSRFPIFKTMLVSSLPLFGAIHFALTTTIVFPLIVYAVMSLLTFGLYADDKSRAKRGVWRTSENTLHLFELAGGWLGGFIAQQTLYHKSSKSSYQAVFWTIVVIHYMLWLGWLLFGKSLLR
ncbi:cold-shock DNA-binding domain protein [Calothrix sp. NIES-4071]|nr:cold-shock DNA-binding domain protein [Calothrix sp. NIES-4071]BAZ56083.1 cold-shock DNA-binding domain protein [Calothrix sp. NIES-4105]